MKKISDDQINAILNAILRTNITAQVYQGIQNLFANLPVVEDSIIATDPAVVPEK